MFDYAEIFKYLKEENYDESKLSEIKNAVSVVWNENDGNIKKWLPSLKDLPVIKPTKIDLKNSVSIGVLEDCDIRTQENLKTILKSLHPWRKGPFNLFDININTEWRSDWKWDRLKNELTPLKDRKILDVGCGNGYHCFRMLGEGAEFVLGIDPNKLFSFQFNSIKKYLIKNSNYKNANIHLLPLTLEQFPPNSTFDTVFSMGVLYHRKSPIDHLFELYEQLNKGGELVLETLIIEGEKGEMLMPEGRYAKMRNTWFIPSIPTLEVWLKRVGFKNIRIIDVTKTTIEEQRSTEWMKFDSLNTFLDKNNSDLTVEGYPAPIRVVIIAEKS